MSRQGQHTTTTYLSMFSKKTALKFITRCQCYRWLLPSSRLRELHTNELVPLADLPSQAAGDCISRGGTCVCATCSCFSLGAHGVFVIKSTSV